MLPTSNQLKDLAAAIESAHIQCASTVNEISLFVCRLGLLKELSESTNDVQAVNHVKQRRYTEAHCNSMQQLTEHIHFLIRKADVVKANTESELEEVLMQIGIKENEIEQVKKEEKEKIEKEAKEIEAHHELMGKCVDIAVLISAAASNPNVLTILARKFAPEMQVVNYQEEMKKKNSESVSQTVGVGERALLAAASIPHSVGSVLVRLLFKWMSRDTSERPVAVHEKVQLKNLRERVEKLNDLLKLHQCICSMISEIIKLTVDVGKLLEKSGYLYAFLTRSLDT